MDYSEPYLNTKYFKARNNGKTIFFSLSSTQMNKGVPDYEGPPTKQEVMIPIHWEINGGEVKDDCWHLEKVLELDIKEEILRD